jgi:hypothetical protein
MVRRAARVSARLVDCVAHAALIACMLAITAAPAPGQMMSRPTDAPQVSAAGESWYQLREPIQYAGEAYYPAGAAVFFRATEMVRTGHYNGIPIYADATQDPYSIVYVPIGGGRLQPYERPRRGDLAGSTGSRPPAFPVALRPEGPVTPMAAGAPTSLPFSIGAIGAFTPELMTSVASALAARTAAPVCTCESADTAAEPVVIPVAAAFHFDGVAVITARRPDNNDGLWVRYDNATWVSRGVAEPRTDAFTQIGERDGFPVFRKRDAGDDVIYLPSRGGLVAPYRRKA